ncbi:hypothetical protein [Terasakiella sp. SH-1]|uniref:hypothetical protein n=1 Tax=Terasakiella sp. SH-1 TaxID=2560057 RepID=UPI001073FEC4|nr:hypothetical protein [Terasakiella sp. SH-1]
MNLDELIKNNEIVQMVKQSIDDPFMLVLTMGLGVSVFMLILLRLTFLSMGKADKKKAQEVL